MLMVLGEEGEVASFGLVRTELDNLHGREGGSAGQAVGCTPRPPCSRTCAQVLRGEGRAFITWPLSRRELTIQAGFGNVNSS